MKTLTETFIDKSTWAEGPWQHEPDKVQWMEAGLPCLIVRAGITGSLCGYVGVPKGHSYFKKPYSEVDVRVHGGLTYSDLCVGHICHVVEKGEDDQVWWLGFDCAHGFDVMPAMDARIKGMLERSGEKPHPLDFSTDYGSYKELKWVKREVRRLAKQLRKRNGIRA